MSKHSQPFTLKSNARRAARKAGVNPNSVRSCPGGWHYELPAEGAAPKAKAETKAKAKPAAKEPKLKLEGGDGKPPKGSALQRLSKQRKSDGTDQRSKVLHMILRDGGAKMSELEKETGLLPHTLRARISEIKRAEKLNVKRERPLGVTVYSATRKAA